MLRYTIKTQLKYNLTTSIMKDLTTAPANKVGAASDSPGREKPHTPVTPEQPTVFISKDAANGTFDVAPFLEALSFSGADGMAVELDDIMQDLTTYYMDVEPGYTRANELLYALRLLRNALLKGGGYLDIHQ